jgi:hypothetical protein
MNGNLHREFAKGGEVTVQIARFVESCPWHPPEADGNAAECPVSPVYGKVPTLPWGVEINDFLPVTRAIQSREVGKLGNQLGSFPQGAAVALQLSCLPCRLKTEK